MAGEADALAAGLTGLSEGQREQAMTRWRLLAPHFEDGVPLARIAGQSGVGERTLQRWAGLYRAGVLSEPVVLLGFHRHLGETGHHDVR